jgi:hypothetical protein
LRLQEESGGIRMFLGFGRAALHYMPIVVARAAKQITRYQRTEQRNAREVMSRSPFRFFIQRVEKRWRMWNRVHAAAIHDSQGCGFAALKSTELHVTYS